MSSFTPDWVVVSWTSLACYLGSCWTHRALKEQVDFARRTLHRLLLYANFTLSGPGSLAHVLVTRALVTATHSPWDCP